MNTFTEVTKKITDNPKRWLVTGAAGFIGSNLLEYLLNNDQFVLGLDNFATGKEENLEEVKKIVGSKKWKNFEFIEGDVQNTDTCIKASNGIDYVLHQAALGSVPRSIENPITTNEANITGFLNMIEASRYNNVDQFVFAASSSTYGDSKELPKIEENIGKPLSPYALTKYVNELYAEIYSKVYGFNSIGLRYFNVFGKRQDPDGAYAAVIPKWIGCIMKNQNTKIYGDGETSRDFCYIDNAVQANILAATSKLEGHQIFNVAVGERTSLNRLLQLISENFKEFGLKTDSKKEYAEFRSGDVRHSLADISKIKTSLGYSPSYCVNKGIKETVKWYIENNRI